MAGEPDVQMVGGWWKLYRQERVKVVKQRPKHHKRTWRVTLTPQEITRAAREATRRWNEGQR